MIRSSVLSFSDRKLNSGSPFPYSLNLQDFLEVSAEHRAQVNDEASIKWALGLVRGVNNRFITMRYKGVVGVVENDEVKRYVDFEWPHVSSETLNRHLLKLLVVALELKIYCPF